MTGAGGVGMQLENAFAGDEESDAWARRYSYQPRRYSSDLVKFLHQEFKPLAARLLKDALKTRKKESRAVGYKFSCEVQVLYTKIVPAQQQGDRRHEEPLFEEHFSEPWFKTKTEAVLHRQQVDDVLNRKLQEILEKSELYLHNGSGWTFVKVLSAKMTLVKFVLFSGGGGGGKRTIKKLSYQAPRLPEYILRKKACISPKQVRLGDCFINCIVLAGQPPERRRSFWAKKLMSWLEKTRLDFSGLSYPATLAQIPSFERRNNLVINVYALVKEGRPRQEGSPGGKSAPIRILYLSKNLTKNDLPREDRFVDLLLYKKHFFLITNLSRLLGRAVGKRKKYVCRSCFSYFPTEIRREEHWTSCCARENRLFSAPKSGRKTFFRDFGKMTDSPFVVYYDFETMAVATDKLEQKEHKPIAVGAIRICKSDRSLSSDLFISFGKECVEKFLDWLDGQEKEMSLIQATRYKPLKMRAEDWSRFNRQKYCEMCGCRFGPLNTPRKDHCHLSGRFRYSLCNKCNLTYASVKSLEVPCFAHFATRFDQHLFIKALVARRKKIGERPPRILPRNTEHYLAVYASPYIFLDSGEFMKSSLHSIVESMKQVGSTIGSAGQAVAFPLLFEHLSGNAEKYDAMSGKGVFCYDFLDSEEKLQLNLLPMKEDFYDSLHKKHISDEDYEHAKRVWQVFHCRTLKDYLRIYLESDVLLLADCFERFRDLSLKYFKMDVAKFLTLPHFAYHAMLRYTGVTLDVLDDIEMIQWLRRSVRGGVASIMHRYARANMPEMGEDFKREEPRREILALDCTNLYGHALCQSLPEKNYRWLSPPEIENLDLMAIPKDSVEGYILSVDLAYPPELHQWHSMYPLAPDKRSVPPALWSPRTHQSAMELEDAAFFKPTEEKLIPDLLDKDDYVVHYQNLQFYLKHGLRLKRIRRVLAFQQSAWLAGFVDFITEQRKLAVSEFESSFWKLIVNSIFGRLLMDKGKHINMKLVSQEKQFTRYASKPTFKSVTFYDKSFVGVQMMPSNIVIDNPIAVGYTCLELSKLHMYKFHYNYALPELGGPKKCQLLMTDTDSLVYLVENLDAMALFSANKQYFDFSNFPQTHPLFSRTNKKVKGTFKIEYPDNRIVGFAGLRAKMYCFLHLSSESAAKAKGIPRTVVKNLRFQDFTDVLFVDSSTKKTPLPHRCRFKTIRSKKHRLYTIEQEKKGLSCLDLKRWICQDGVHTLAYGDYRCNRSTAKPM